MCSRQKANSAPKFTSDEMSPIWPTKNSTSTTLSALTTRIALIGTWRPLIFDKKPGSWRSRLIEYSSRLVAAWAAIALANPTAKTLTTKNAFIQPVLDAASTSLKNALPASSSLNDSRPPASRLASHVCMTNRNATMNSDTIIARPAGFFLPVDSSARVEIPSKPRKLSTAIDNAAAMRGALTTSEFQIGVVLQPTLGRLWPLMARTAMITKMTTKTNSIAKKTRLAIFSESMPSRLMTVLTTTNTIAHIQRGVPGNRPIIDSA